MTNSTLDAAGRPLRIGDTVGGTVESHPDTVIGTVTSMTPGTVVVETKPGMQWSLLADRTFWIGRPLVGNLGAGTRDLALNGPALFYVTPEENGGRTVVWADRSAPDDQREREVCHALILHALELSYRLPKPFPGVDDGPAVIYAASDRATLTRVDEGIVEDLRERSICRALLKYARDLAEQPVPVRVDEHGRILP